MKKISLNETWRLCMKQWRWVVRQIKAGSKKTVGELKDEWCEKHGFDDLRGNCFFCDVTFPGCSGCPAKKVDKEFSCINELYHYVDKSIAFLEELKRLNRIRLKGCGN